MCSCDCVLYWIAVMCQTFCLEPEIDRGQQVQEDDDEDK